MEEFKAQFAEERRKEQQAAEAAKAAEIAASTTETQEVDLSKPLYGNQDKKKQFNIRDIIPLPQLPDNKVIILKQTFVKLPSGDEHEDKKLREIQFIDPLDFEAFSKPQQATGLSAYDALGLAFTVLHQPGK